MLSLARGRVALGVVAFAAPGLTAKLLGGAKTADGSRDLVTRMFAAREIAVGAGYLLSKDSDRRLWARVGLAIDTLDTVGGLRTRKNVPVWASAGVLAAAGGCTALGAAKVAKDIVR
nr:hypothetical protein GCM10010200_052720 [Actinomadura rugatobispora]